MFKPGDKVVCWYHLEKEIYTVESVGEKVTIRESVLRYDPSIFRIATIIDLTEKVKDYV